MENLVKTSQTALRSLSENNATIALVKKKVTAINTLHDMLAAKDDNIIASIEEHGKIIKEVNQSYNELTDEFKEMKEKQTELVDNEQIKYDVLHTAKKELDAGLKKRDDLYAIIIERFERNTKTYEHQRKALENRVKEVTTSLFDKKLDKRLEDIVNEVKAVETLITDANKKAVEQKKVSDNLCKLIEVDIDKHKMATERQKSSAKRFTEEFDRLVVAIEKLEALAMTMTTTLGHTDLQEEVLDVEVCRDLFDDGTEPVVNVVYADSVAPEVMTTVDETVDNDLNNKVKKSSFMKGLFS